MKSLKLILMLFFLTFAISCGQQKKYIEYKIKKGETISIIANRLDIDTKDLLRLNPDVETSPKPNTIIIIPNKKNSNPIDSKLIEKKEKELVIPPTDEKKEETPIEDDLDDLKNNFIVHTVKKGDTFYSLTHFYNVTAEDLKKLNPILSEGLKVGEIIKIKSIDTKNVEVEEIYKEIIDENRILKVALLLPFRAKKYDSVSAIDIFKKKKTAKREKLVNIVTDLYLGAEIAIDSLRKQGVQIELNVYDTGKKNGRIRTILSNYNLNDNDVIIGPLYSSEAEVVANQVKVSVVFPVYSKNQEDFSSSKLIKTSPEKKRYRNHLINYIKEIYNGENIVVVSDKYALASSIKQMLIVHDSIVEVQTIFPEKGYIEKERLLKLLKPKVQNWVIIATNNNVLAEDAMNTLISLPEETTAKVFAIEKGTAFGGIDNLKLAQIEFTYVSDIFLNENTTLVKIFDKQYRAKNNTYPSNYASKGFDITYDVLVRLASGKNLKSTFKKGVSYRLISKFDYDNKLFNSTENNGLFIIKYNLDLTLTRLK